MRDIRKLLLIGCLVFSGAYLAPMADAGNWDDKTVVTFDRPVELPGIVLPAGVYVFKLANSPVDRNIVQVLSRDERTLYATINTIPDYRTKTTEGTSLVFDNKGDGQAQSLKAWFYPDRRYGHEFVYSNKEPLQLAKTDEPRNPPESMASAAERPAESSDTSSYTEALHKKQNELHSSAGSEASETASGDLDNAQALHQNQADESGSLQASMQSATPAVLPRTGSLLPLVFLSGVSLLAASFGIRLYSRRNG